MAEKEGGRRLEMSLAITFVVVMLLSGVLIVVGSFGKTTNFSAYEEGGDDRIQLTDARETFAAYNIGNTIATPMLVNDWLKPHRTVLLIVAPERPFDRSEAQAIHDFVTQKGGKVILASDSTHANLIAEMFGVTYFDAPLIDLGYNYSMEDLVTGDTIDNPFNVWSFGSATTDTDNLTLQQKRTGCRVEVRGSAPVFTDQPAGASGCRMPIMFRSATGMQVKPVPADEETRSEFPGSACQVPRDPTPAEMNHCRRRVSRLAMASPSAIIDRVGDHDPNNVENPAPGDLAYVIRVDYPGIEVLENVGEGEEDFVDVTGSIVFVSDEEALTNAYWTQEAGIARGMSPACTYVDRHCWYREIGEGQREWLGNEAFFAVLIHDMMEFNNEAIADEVVRGFDHFNLVFDESRHAQGVATPFTETMSTIVLLTSDVWLKWLILMNLVSILFIAIMVVPQKENWRHVFDLTRFRERPLKPEERSYHQRVRESLFTKVRLHLDLTREEIAIKPPSEIQRVIAEPRLIELAYSQKEYTPEQLHELLKLIRRWGK